LQSSAPGVPVILLSDTKDEISAIECLKAGAIDYVLKTHLERLPFLILNSFEKQLIRQENKDSEEKLREKEFIYNQILENSNNAVFLIKNERFELINTSFER